MIKTLLKLIGITAELFLIALILGYIIMRIWLVSRFDTVVEDLNYKAFCKEIQSTPSLPPAVFEAFAMVNGYDERSTTNEFLVRAPFRLFNMNAPYSICPCVEVNYGFVDKTKDRWTVGLQLDEDVGPKKCLEYYLNDYYFDAGGRNGIRYASTELFGKSLEKLTERQMLVLCLLTKNSSLYDPTRHPERVEQEIDRILSN